MTCTTGCHQVPQPDGSLTCLTRRHQTSPPPTKPKPPRRKR